MKAFAIAVLAALSLFNAHTVTAAQTPTGTIAVDPSSDLRLGGLVTFDWTTQNLGHNNPRIDVTCYQGTIKADEQQQDASNSTVLVAAVVNDGVAYWAEYLNGDNFPTFVQGPADCVATLFYWDFHPSQTFVPLASVAFSVTG